MSQEQQIRDHQESSPYVAHSGAVGHLGQPGSVESERPSQAPGNGSYGTGAANPQYGQQQQQQQHHPLEATHDTNIGHGHEPFSASTMESGYVAPAEDHRQRGMGEKMKDAVKGAVGGGGGGRGHHPDKYSSDDQVPAGQETGAAPVQQQKSPGFVGKLKDAVTGQKPGYGAATGNATSGSAVPGEADHKGNFEDKGWPRPVPPPGMSKASVTSDRPGEPHYPSTNRHDAGAPESYSSGHGQQSGVGSGVGGAAYQNVDKPGHEGSTYNPEQQSYGGAPESYSSGHGQQPGVGSGVGGAAYQNVDKPGHEGSMYNPEQQSYGGAPESYSSGHGQQPGVGSGVGGAAYQNVGKPGHEGSTYNPEQQSYGGAPESYSSGHGQQPGVGSGVGGAAYQNVDKPGHEGSTYNPEQQSYGAQKNVTQPEPGTGGLVGTTYQGETGTGMEHRSHAGESYGTGDPTQKSGAGTDSSNKPSKTLQEELYPPESYKGAEHVSTPASTPAEPNARHDTPGQNEVGGEYKDSHGSVHKEGPRDDNVKKEGLMAKMMDKLHLSPKSRDRGHKDSTTATTPTTS